MPFSLDQLQALADAGALRPDQADSLGPTDAELAAGTASPASPAPPPPPPAPPPDVVSGAGPAVPTPIGPGPGPSPAPPPAAGVAPPPAPTVPLRDPLAMVGAGGDPRAVGLANAAALGDAQKAQQAQVAAHEGAQGDRLADLTTAAADEQSAIGDAAAKKQAAWEARMDEAYKAQQAATDRLSQASVDPDHYWQEKGTGSKIGFAILSMAAVALPMLRPVVGMVQHEVNADIQRQKQRIEADKGAIEGNKGLLAQALSVTGNMRDAEHAARADALQRVKLQLDAQSARYRGTEAGDKYRAASIDLDQKINEQRSLLAHSIASDRASAAAAAESRANERAHQAFEETEEHLKGVREDENNKGNRAIENRKADIEEKKAGQTQDSAAVQDAALAADLEAVRREFQNARQNMPGRIMGKLGSIDGRQGTRQYEAGKAQIANAITSAAERGETAWMNKVEPKLPQPGDSDDTLAQKEREAVESVLGKHPEARSRSEQRRAVQAQLARTLKVGPAVP